MGFNRYVGTGVTTATDIVTCGAGTVMTIIGVTVSNITGSDTTVDVTAAGARVLKGTALSAGSSVVPVGGEQKIVLIDGDTLTVTADFAVDVIVSVLEQTV